MRLDIVMEELLPGLVERVWHVLTAANVCMADRGDNDE